MPPIAGLRALSVGRGELAAAPMTLVFRQAAEADKRFIWRLTVLGYRDAVVKQFGEWDAAFQTGHFERKWANQGYRIILRGGEEIGAIWTTEESDCICLHEILLMPAWQGQGIGTQLVQAVIEQARSKQKPIRLTVLKASRARFLYERLGFRITGDADVASHHRMQYGA